jgi:hypothetical protein
MGVASYVFIEIHLFQYLETQSSYDTPNGFPSFKKSSTRPYTLCTPENTKKTKKSKEKNRNKIQFDLLLPLLHLSIVKNMDVIVIHGSGLKTGHAIIIFGLSLKHKLKCSLS